MTISGSSVKDDIESVIDQLSAKHAKANKSLDNCESSIEALTAERENTLIQLATTYLPELDADDIQRTLREMQSEVRNIFKQKQERRSELVGLMEDSETKRKGYETRLKEVTERLNGLVAERDTLSLKMREELTKDPSYKAIAERANVLQQGLGHDAPILEKTKEEFEQKRKAIESNRLYSYLQRRNYGTDEYRGFRVIAFLDRWVARRVASGNGERRVGYEELQKAHDYLFRMPLLMQEDFDKRAKELQGLEKRITSAEKKVGDTVGLTAIDAEIAQGVKERDAIKEQIANETTQYGQYSSEKNGLENKKDEYHTKAIQKLKEFLKGQKIADLKERARMTPGSEDDTLVYRLEHIDQEVRNLKDIAKETRNEAEGLSSGQTSLKRILEKFNRDDYDSSRSYFPGNFDIQSFLTGYLSGQYTEKQVWKEIEDNQKFKPRETYSSYSGGGYSGGYSGRSSRRDSGDDSWSSGSSGSSWGSGGSGGGGISFGGGGFGGGGVSIGRGGF